MTCTAILISGFGQTTGTGLAGLLEGSISHDRIQRLLSKEQFSATELWQTVKPYTRQIEQADGVNIIDDGIAEKPYTDENEIICWHYDHRQDRSVKGINFVPCLYHASGYRLPVGFSSVAKTEYYLEIYLESVDFPLLLVKQVFANEDGSTGIQYLVSSDTTLSADQMTTIYRKRWNVEPYHKSLKQNASLEKSPTQTVTTQSKHLFASLYAYIKPEWLRKATKLNHFALKAKLYITVLHSAFDTLRLFQPIHLAA